MGQADHYYSRRGETLDTWVEAAKNGSILIFPHLAENHDTVKKLALKQISDSKAFDRIEELPVYVPADLTDDAAITIINDLRRVFSEPTTTDTKTLRVAIFYIFTDEKGQFSRSVDTFCHVLFDKTKNGKTRAFADPDKGNLTIFPIVDITSGNILDKPAEKIFRKLRGRAQSERAPKRVKFDIRTFDYEHLIDLLQPEFPEEDLRKNPDFDELAESFKGESRIAFAIRNYRRKKTLEHFRNAKGGPLTGNDFSTVFGFVKSVMLGMDITVVPKSGRGPASR